MLRKTIAWIALGCAGLSLLLFKQNRAPRGFYLVSPKLLAGALEPFIGAVGLVCAMVGLLNRAWLAAMAGIVAVLAAFKYLQDTVAQPQASMSSRFERAFGPTWAERLASNIPQPQQRAILPRRWTWSIPRAPEPRFQRDLPFWSNPHTGRTLLCDLWSPPPSVCPSGLGVVYFHGSAW